MTLSERIIDAYCADLRRELAATGIVGRRQRRIVAEVADHLLEAAGEHGGHEVVLSTAAAGLRLGTPSDLARRFADELAPVLAYKATMAVLASLLLELTAWLLAISAARSPSDVWLAGSAAHPLYIPGLQLAVAVGALTLIRAVLLRQRRDAQRDTTALLLRGGWLVTATLIALLAAQSARVLAEPSQTLHSPLAAAFVLVLVATGAAVTRAVLALRAVPKRLPLSLAPSPGSDGPESSDAIDDLVAFGALCKVTVGRRAPLWAALGDRLSWATLSMCRRVVDRAPWLSALLDLRAHPRRSLVVTALAAAFTLTVLVAVLGEVADVLGPVQDAHLELAPELDVMLGVVEGAAVLLSLSLLTRPLRLMETQRGQA